MRYLINVCVMSLLTARAVSAMAQSDAPPIQIVLYPAGETEPALKYRLLPPFVERRPGNAAVWWNRLPAERGRSFDQMDRELTNGGRLFAWMQIPIGTPAEKAYREKELGKLLPLLRKSGTHSIHSDMERAASFESCDWQLPVHEGDFVSILLPEVQQMRSFARILEAKAHLEIVERRYDDAIRTFQTGFAEGRQVAEGPTLINGLVGVTIAGIMSHQLRQFIQQPDAPNLYWALSTLPKPLISMRSGGEAESELLYLQFPQLREIEKKNLTAAEWSTLLNEAIVGTHKVQLSNSQHSPVPAGEYQAKIAKASTEGYPRAKQYLIDHGRSAAEVDAMSVAQVVLLYSVALYNELSDDQYKWFLLSSAESTKGSQLSPSQLKELIAAKHEIIPLAEVLLTPCRPAKNAEIRCQWTIDVLRIFEAMRLYAAAHAGKWPDRLSDITVPLPLNPYDNSPFVYERNGDKATLTCTSGPPSMPWRYEITLKPAGAIEKGNADRRSELNRAPDVEK